MHVKSYADELNKLQEKVAVICETKLEARFSRVRTEETNLGNFIADLIRTEFQADFGHFNGGGLRANCVFDAGPLKHKFISQCLPNEDKIVKISLSGKLYKEVLENGISNYPKYDGRWPVTSGIMFEFDPSKEKGQRIVEGSLKK